ncbi:hypothetical protein OIO90_005310 [Microbotryomycetes sp. JL221]|nr:hypothetical protein OIO90_005310 [Microbotryomycetes sp. JL221]
MRAPGEEAPVRSATIDHDGLTFEPSSATRAQRRSNLCTDKPLHVLHRDAFAVDSAELVEPSSEDAQGDLNLHRLSPSAHGSGLASMTSVVSQHVKRVDDLSSAPPDNRVLPIVASSTLTQHVDDRNRGLTNAAAPRTACASSSANWASKLSSLPFQTRPRPSQDSMRSDETTDESDSLRLARPREVHRDQTINPTAPTIASKSTASIGGSTHQPRPCFAANSFASLQQLPGLPTIPASPLSPPPFARSHTSPQLNPTILSNAPIPSLDDGISPSSPAALASPWQPSPLAVVLQRHHRSLSAPQLSISIPTEAPMLPPPLAHTSLLTPVQVRSNDSSPLESALVVPRFSSSIKLYHALQELVETERGYLERLRTLVTVYFRTLPFLPILSKQDAAVVVRNAEDLLSLHEHVMQRLEQACLLMQALKAPENDDDDRKLTKAAGKVANIPKFAAYNEYCSRQTEAMDIVRTMTKRPDWDTYERQCSLSSSSGDQTPLANITQSPFFASTPTLVGLPATSPDLTRPSSDSPAPALASTDSSASARSRLRFADHAIAPVQRICRYPLLFASVLKQMPDGEDREAVEAVWDKFKQVCEAVDEAKRAREGEQRTRVVASRMEFLAPTSSAFCSILGPTLLVGTLHYFQRTALSEPLRIKYYGCFLYRTHLVVCKIKRRLSYEPREWLPLRLFDLTSIEEGEGLLPHSFRMSHKEHVFEFGATCESEKSIWLDRLCHAQRQAFQAWQNRKDDSDHVDESVISSVVFAPAGRRNHSRTPSFASVGASQSEDLLRHPGDSPVLNIASSLPQGVTKSNRISATASALLGRTPAVQRAAIDLRLSDGVFSEELTAARAQAIRDGSSMSLSRTPSSSARIGALGHAGPMRSMTAQAQASLKSLGRDKRRMSSHELQSTLSHDVRSKPIGFDANIGVVFSGTADHKTSLLSSSPVRKSKSSHGRSKLPEIDTKLPAAVGRGGARNASVIRRAASHSDLISPTPKTPTMPAMPAAVISKSAAAEVERNNSVSSTTSSSGTGTNSSSSHGLAHASLYSDETPPPSVPPSPDCLPLDLDQLHSMLPSKASIPQDYGNIVATLKVQRRRSLFGTEALTQDDAGELNGSGTVASGLHRRASTKIGSFFTKRVQSSPTLSNLFAHSISPSSQGRPGSSAASSTLSLAASSFGPTNDAYAASRHAVLKSTHASASTPSLDLSPVSTTAADQTLVSPLSSDEGSTTSGSGASSPVAGAFPARRPSKSRSSTKSSFESMRSFIAPTSMALSAQHSSSNHSTSRNKSMRSLFKLTPIS